MSKHSPRLSDTAAVAEVRPFDLGMFDPAGQAAVATRAGEFFKGLEGSTRIRILALARPFSAAPAVRAVQELRRACPADEDWRLAGLAGFQTFLELLVRRANLRGTQYFLLAWTKSDLPPLAIQRSAADSFMTAVTPLDGLPPFFADCREEWQHLAPIERGGEYLAVYGSHALLGTWDVGTIQRLLRMPFPVAVSIDIETLTGDRAERQLQSTYNTLTAQLQSHAKISSKDAGSEQGYRDVQRTMNAVQDSGERLHKVTITVLIKASSAEQLVINAAQLRARLSAFVRFRPLWGQQGEALKLFTTIARTAIAVDLRSAPMLSSGCALTVPFGLPSRFDTSGVLWGIDRSTNNPVWYDIWARAAGAGATPAHATFLGFTGYGKTFAQQVMLYRHALTGTKVIVLEPQGHFRKLAAALGAGASYNPISFATPMNLLDVIHPAADKLGDQISHVKRMLALLLSCESGAAESGSETGRRIFTNSESGALGRALHALYAPCWGDPWTPATTPLLGDLCARLDLQRDDAGRPHAEAVALAREIRDLYVTGEKAASFNRPSTLDLSLDRQCTVYNVAGIDRTYRPLYYMQLVAVFNHFIRDPARIDPRTGRRVPVIICIDEFKYMGRDRVLSAEAANLTKTTRAFDVAVWTADQNPGSYMQNEDARQMIALSSLVFIGRQQANDLPLNQELFERLTPYHRTQMLTAQRGEFVAKFNDDYYVLKVEPSAVELAAFSDT